MFTDGLILHKVNFDSVSRQKPFLQDWSVRAELWHAGRNLFEYGDSGTPCYLKNAVESLECCRSVPVNEVTVTLAMKSVDRVIFKSC